MLIQSSIHGMWYTSGVFREGKMFLHIGCAQLGEGTDYQGMGLKSYWGSVMPLRYCAAMDGSNDVNWHCILSHSSSPADNGISVPPSSPTMSMINPPPTPPTNRLEREKESVGSSVEVLLMNVAEGGSGGGTSVSTEKVARTSPPVPTETDAGDILLTPTNNVAGKILPPPTNKVAYSFLTTHTEKDAGATSAASNLT